MYLRQLALGLVLSFTICLLSGCALFGVPANNGTTTPTPGPVPGPPPVPVPPPTLGDITKINHIIFMAQENRSFDHYLGHLNAYRALQGLGEDVDGTPSAVSNPRSEERRVGKSVDLGGSW